MMDSEFDVMCALDVGNLPVFKTWKKVHKIKIHSYNGMHAEEPITMCADFPLTVFLNTNSIAQIT